MPAFEAAHFCYGFENLKRLPIKRKKPEKRKNLMLVLVSTYQRGKPALAVVSGKVAGEAWLKVRGDAYQPCSCVAGGSANFGAINRQHGRPLAKITAVTLDGPEQTDQAIAQCSLHSNGQVSTARTNNFSFVQRCWRGSHKRRVVRRKVCDIGCKIPGV